MTFRRVHLEVQDEEASWLMSPWVPKSMGVITIVTASVLLDTGWQSFHCSYLCFHGNWMLMLFFCFFFSVIASSESSQDTHIWLALSGSMPILPHSLFSQETGEQIFHFSRLQNETQENWILNWCGADLLNAYIPELDTKHYATCMKCDLTGHLTSSSFVYSSNIIIFLISLFRENTVSFDGNFSKLRNWLSTEQEQEDECLLYSSSIVSSCQVQLLCLNKEQRVCKTCSVY